MSNRPNSSSAEEITAGTTMAGMAPDSIGVVTPGAEALVGAVARAGMAGDAVAVVVADTWDARDVWEIALSSDGPLVAWEWAAVRAADE